MIVNELISFVYCNMSISGSGVLNGCILQREKRRGKGEIRTVVKEIDIRGINSPYVILIQADDGTVIASSRPDEAVYPASITKVMSALVVLEHVKGLDRTCTIREDVILDLCAEEASMAGFQPGEEVTVRDLLYGALLPSGAECCETLAGLVGGTTEAFVAMMNDKAASLGMDSTCFRNTTGLFDPEHVSTVRDLAVMMQYAIRNRAFREIAGSASHTTAPTNLHPEGLVLCSTLFSKLPDPTVAGGTILGGKTGSTDEAKLCLASYAAIAGKEYILVTCGAELTGEPLHVYDALTLYNRVGEAVLYDRSRNYSSAKSVSITT